jgi:class 3 adenylate cyclase
MTAAIHKRRNIPDRIKWGLIIGELFLIYALVLITTYLNAPLHNLLRFLVLFPMCHAGATFGYRGGFLASLLAIFLFVPIIKYDTPYAMYHFPVPASMLLFTLFALFGILVGGTIGESRKSRGYLETMSAVLLEIFREQDERSIIRRSCIEAAAITGAAGGAFLLIGDDQQNAAEWLMFDMSADDDNNGPTPALPPDNVLVRCAMRNMSFITNSAGHDDRATLGPRAAGVRSIIAAPVSFEQTVYGAFVVVKGENRDNFAEKELSILKTIAETAGGAIHNLRQERNRQEEKLREEQMRDLFSRYSAPAIVDYVLEHPELLSSRRQEVTVLVSDIRGFTSFSETTAPEEVVAQLNEYFTAMVDIIFENNGIIDKFIGDCIIAYWGAPAPDAQHSSNAIRAASAMARALDILNTSWARRGLRPFSSGIAIHTCDVLMGNIGDDRKLAFTIMGDEVDKAIRMESATKALGAKIIVSETAARASGFRLSPLSEAPAELGCLFTLAGDEL